MLSGMKSTCFPVLPNSVPGGPQPTCQPPHILPPFPHPSASAALWLTHTHTHTHTQTGATVSRTCSPGGLHVPSAWRALVQSPPHRPPSADNNHRLLQRPPVLGTSGSPGELPQTTRSRTSSQTYRVRICQGDSKALTVSKAPRRILMRGQG